MWKSTIKSRTRSAGFTLVELMVTLGIIAIVAAVAYPAYQGYSTTGRRPVSKVALSQIAMAQEKFFSNNNTYADQISSLPGFGTSDPFITEGGYYSISVAAGPTESITTSFKLTATPQGGQAGDSCTELTLDSTGAKGGTPSKDECW